MRLDRLKRWQWMLIGIGVGLLIGILRNLAFSGLEAEQMESMSLPVFTRAINTPPVKGYAMIKDIRVVRLKDGSYGVLLQYMDWNAPDVRSGKKKAEYKQHWLQPGDQQLKAAIAALEKKQTKTQMETSGGFDRFLRKVAEVTRMKPADPPGTVLEYMRLVTDNKGNHVAFTYDWQRQPRVMILSWLLLGFVGIGVVWPFIVNLIAFGSLFRPEDKDKGVDLRKVKSTPAKAEYRPQNVVTGKDMDELKRLEMELEAKLKASGVEMTAPPAPSEEAPRLADAPRQLTATKLDMAQVDEKKEDKHFDRKEGDFYPVERNIKKEGEE